MKYFLIRIISYCLPLFIVLVSVNYFGDAAHIFNANYEMKMVDIICQGKNVTNISNYDERSFQRLLINKLKTCPEVIIVGSSTTMLINSDSFNKKIFFNNSVSGASIEDIVGIYQLYVSRSFIPRKIVIGIDPWTFNEQNKLTRWKTLKSEYQRFIRRNGFKPTYSIKNFNTNYYELISPSYFQSSLKNLIYNINNINSIGITANKLNAGNTVLNDGSLVYGKVYREAPSDQIMEKVNNYIQGDIYSIEKFDRLSPRIMEVFNKFIEELVSLNIEVVFFLPPYHPKVFEKIRSGYPSVIDSENFIRKLASGKNIKVLGSFNPIIAGVGNSDFYDGMHCNESGIAKIFDQNN